MGEKDGTTNTDVDPGEYTIPELGPTIKEIDDLDELEAILETEKEGEDRVGATKLIESRIEKFAEDEEDDDGEIDPTEMSPADIGNVLRDIDDIDVLMELIDTEEAGEDRDSVKRLIQNRIDSVSGSEDGESEADLPPEEKYPDLNHPTEDKQYIEGVADGEYRDMWVYCETQQGELLDVSKEMLGKARDLMDGYNADYDEDERVVAILIGDDASEYVEDVIAYGADRALYQEDDRLSRFLLKPYTEIYAAMAREDDDWREYDEPRYALFPATNNGRDLSATAMAELDSGLASDCSGLTIEDTVISNPAKTGGSGKKRGFERVLHMKRPDFSGFEYSTILCLDKPNRDFHPQGGSVIPGSFEMPDPDPEREGEVIEWELDLPHDWFRVKVTEHDVLEGGVDLTGNDVIVALGRGIGDNPTRGIELGMDLVAAFEEADLGLSRGVVTASYNFDGHVEQYISEERQIGESGQEVEPDVYIAAGISGAIQHKVGMDESDTIIAVNTDTDADIRDFSDYFVEGDLFDVLPAMIEAIEAGELDVQAIADGAGGEDA
jgi:electron transfer flavoprotein alpha subunit